MYDRLPTRSMKMGKKSKKRSSKTRVSPSSESENDVSAIMKVPPGTECWICLESEPDDAGHCLVRDCSCRGLSGFGHLSCITKYAQQKSKELSESSGAHNNNDFSKPWRFCPNCDQRYENKLGLDMADSFISFTKSNFACDPLFACPEFPCDPRLFIECLFFKLCALQESAEIDKSDLAPWKASVAEGEKIGSEVISIVDRMRDDSMLIFGTKSLPLRIANIESNVYDVLGSFVMGNILAGIVGADEAMDLLVGHFEKYRDLSLSIGCTPSVHDAEMKIAQGRALSKTKRGSIGKKHIDNFREQYKKNPAIPAGTSLAMALGAEGYGIECQRLLLELLAKSRQIHGERHHETRSLVNCLKLVAARRVFVEIRGREKMFAVIRYEDEGDKCVLKPLSNESKRQSSMVVKSERITIAAGTPVICQGLKNANHMNGKIGDVRSFDSDKKRYEVHFEDPCVRPCFVKPSNLRIIFELPEK